MTRLVHPRLAAIAAHNDAVRADLAAVVESAQASALTCRPPDGGWSGAQILQHLGKTEGAIAKMLERAFAEAPDLPMETEATSLLGSLDAFAVEVSGTKLIAPAGIRPDDSPDPAASWASLRAVRERTYRAFAAVDGRALGVISAPHPYFGPLTAYQWLLFLGKHEVRHLQQLRHTLAAQ